MKNKVRIILFLIISLFVFPFATKEVYAYENIDYEPKIYCEINEEYDFALDSVLVMIDKNLSDVNKVFEKTFFGNLDIINIEDLTYRENWDFNLDIKEENFRQTLELHLETQTKDNIVNIIKELEKIDGIVCVSPNYIGMNGLVAVNDANYFRQWGLNGTNGIDIEQAWDYVIGTREVRVGILDTGITPHVDLNANLVGGFSYIDGNTNDYGNHGSHVAGIVGAVGNDLGISGVARNISLVPLKFDGDIGDVQSALIDAEENNIKIVNMSWWNFPNSPILENAINDYNGLFVCIAGNGDTNIDIKPNYPASFNLDNMIVVGAIKSDLSRPNVSDWEYDTRGNPQGSNCGANSVDIFAPGDNIYSTVPTNSYLSMSGTSMAAPHVTGVAALLLSINENLTVTQLKNAIMNSAENINITIPDDSIQNVKKLNAYNAVKYVLKNYGSSTTLKYNTKSLSGSVDSTSTFFNEKNYFLKMNVENAYEYDFTISSSSSLEVTLYDSNFNEINVSQTSTNGGLTKTFSYYLSVGTYYLQSNYVSSTASGTINVSIAGEPHTHSYTYSPSTSGHIATCTDCGYTTTLSHVYDKHYCIHCNAYTTTHDYDMNYEWISYTLHNVECSCGESETTQPHAVASGSYNTGQRFATCLLCGGLAEMGFVQLTINSSAVTNVTINGSFILPNGVIVLEDEDLEAYLNGTLVFYDKDKVPVLQ